MNLFERLYDEQENVKVQFTGFTTDEARYDFGIVYTNMFFGKPLVVCMQTGRSALLCADDITNPEHLQNAFHIKERKEAEDLALFFEKALPSMPREPQY
ncbi:DUF3055 domain-containing protein [Bacillus sp. FJAT-45350]|uniref:DUF3055 domain-containing protein n=1 Tax=Bacillus sp. FJAT-45350 TaxID=2011014 RepID=UPI000BB92C89|nr:DUF3055 domain-containing protein [Bacillus sp. FJAT-45350]